jgi:hypothetical protein
VTREETDAEYIRSRVRINPETQCWEWTGKPHTRGYGVTQRRGKRYYVHRFSFATFVGPVNGMNVCHRCDNPICCNPSHLFLGTQADNLADARAKGRLFAPPPMPGEKNPRAKLTATDVAIIRARAAAGESKRSIARDFHVSDNQICWIVSRKEWK